MNVKKSYDVFMKILFIVCIIIYICFLLTSKQHVFKIPFFILIQFVIIGCISVLEILKDKNIYSLNKMHWYFICLFMFIAPVTQIISGYVPWGYKLDNKLMLYSNWMIIIWEIIFLFFYNKRKKIRIIITKKKHYTYPMIIKFNYIERCILIFISLISVFMLVHLVGFNNLFVRDAAQLGGNSVYVVFNYFLRAVPVINSVIFIQQRRKYKNVSIFAIFLLLFCTILLNSPVALSRYWTGVVYIGVIISICPDKFFQGQKFDIFILFIFIVIFPIFSVFKNNTLSDILITGLNLDITETYNSVDFDAYSMLCRVIDYTSNNGIQFGKQLRSVIFFFVPRAVWNIKGMPTGELVSSEQGAIFTNLSSPLISEGYIDFGILGVVVYACIFAKMLRYFDDMYWCYKNNDKANFFEIIIPFMLGFVIFIMRGPLQSTFLRLMGFYLYLILIYCVLKLTLKLRCSI